MKITKTQLRQIIKEEVQKLTERYAGAQVREIDPDNIKSWRDSKKLSPITHTEEEKYNLPARVEEAGYEKVSDSSDSDSPDDRQVNNGVIPIGIHNAEAYYKVQGTDNTFLTLPVMPMQMRGPRFR